MEIITKSTQETKEFGEKFANNLVGNRMQDTRYKGKSALIIALSGELGSGKTTFVQGLATGLGIKQRIVSPTFIIMRKYRISLNARPHPIPAHRCYSVAGGRESVSGATKHRLPYSNFYHVDLYRLEENMKEEVRNLGLEDIWKDPKNIVVIEWVDKIKNSLPQNSISVKFENLGGERRKISIFKKYFRI